MRTHAHALVLGVTLTVATACGDPVPVPTTITILPASATLASIDDTVRLTATVKDQDGQAMSGLTVDWTSGDESVATVDAGGLAMAAGNGTAVARASVEDVSGTLEVTVAQEVVGVQVYPERGS